MKKKINFNVVHTTTVNIDLELLKTTILPALSNNYYLTAKGTRETHEGRSAFSMLNNIEKFYQAQPQDKRSVEIKVEGASSGASARVYYTPSITSLAKPFREAVIPTNPNNKFIFFDLKAAEFFLACLLAGENAVVKDYQNGIDIYERFAKLFPDGASRSDIKLTVIAFIYDVTPFRVAQTFHITESQAHNILRNLSISLPMLERFKASVIARARRENAYFAHAGVSERNSDPWFKVADVDPKLGFNYRTALSASVQSSLGKWMQNLIKVVEKKTNGTVLSVFDSMLIEVPENRIDSAKEFLTQAISPFKTGKFGIGNNFLEATK